MLWFTHSFNLKISPSHKILHLCTAAGRPGPNYLDFQREQKLILAREGIGTLEMFKNAVFQVLPLVVFVAALSRMARFDIFEPLRTGGVLYFVDLTAQDPYSIFPLLSVASTILIFELSSTAPHEARTLQRIIAGVVGCFTFFWTSYFPMVRKELNTYKAYKCHSHEPNLFILLIRPFTCSGLSPTCLLWLYTSYCVSREWESFSTCHWDHKTKFVQTM